MRCWLTLGLGLLLGAALSCAQSGAAEGVPPPAGITDPVVARVNGTEIRDSQLEARVRSTLSRATRSSTELPQERVGAIRKQLLDNLVDEELLYQASLKEAIQVPEKAVEEQVQALDGRFDSSKEFSDSLQQEGMTQSSIRERIRRNLAVEELVKQKVNSRVSFSETEIAEYYQKNRERFRRPEAAHTLELFTPLDRFAGSQTKAQARQAMEAVLKEAKSGRDFVTLIREYSQGSSAFQEGDLGWLTRNGPRPLLAQAALLLRPGELSDILETPAGLHILKVLEKRPAENVTLQEAKNQIESLLRQEKEQSGLRDYLATLKSGAKIEILTPTP
jgi:peptidyl-prolyl cis-trans isomerase C